MPQPGERLHALDAVRAVMMLLGIVLHVACSYTAVPLDVWPYKDAATTPVADLLLFGIHIFRMPIFFVMAGFFTALLLGKRGLGGLLRNRALRIGVPFVLGWLVLIPLVKSGFFFSIGKQAGGWEAGTNAARAYFSEGPLYSDSTSHLWFLYVLLCFYALASLTLWGTARLSPVTRERCLDLFDGLLARWWRPLPFAFLTFLTLIPMRVGSLDTSVSFVPNWRTLLAYAVFFGFGWLLWHRRQRLASFTRFAWTQVALGVALIPVQLELVTRGLNLLPERDWAVHLGCAAVGALSVWFLTFGITGLFLRYLDRPMPKVRYLVDASYWIYLVHLPLAAAVPGLLSDLPWSGNMKLLAALALLTPPLLLSYHYLVRGTPIGVLLNGRRFPMVWPVGAQKHLIVEQTSATPTPAAASRAS